MAVLMIPSLRKDRRCVTVQDCYYTKTPKADSQANRGGTAAAQSPFAAQSSFVAQGGPSAGPQRASRCRAHTFTEAQMMTIAKAARTPKAADCSPAAFGDCSPAGFGVLGGRSPAVFGGRTVPARVGGCSPAGFGAVPSGVGGSPFFQDSRTDSPPKVDAPMKAQRRIKRAKTVGAAICSHVTVSVVAPGGGTGMNASVYAHLARKEGCSVDIVGQSRAAYDRYPASWANEGSPAPNLESFALDLISKDRLANTDCLVVGSRGGQVVLPTLWQALGEDAPPAVVMNGGCAMGLPTPVHWPTNAATFVLLGGQDYFRGSMDVHDYVADAKKRVPQDNKSTAFLLVREMVHMPQAELLNAILMHMIQAVTSWKVTERVPNDEFSTILSNLRRGGWNGWLTYKSCTGDSWNMEAFP